MIKRLAALIVTAAFWSVPAQASVVPGELLGVFSGNDSAAGIMLDLGLTVQQLARIDMPSSIGTSSLSADGLTIDEFTLSDGEATSGRWQYEGLGTVALVVLKAGSNYAVYLFNDTITDGMPNIGLWSTADLDNKGLSHITAYSVVPLPAAGWLMLGALAALFGRRRRIGAN